MLLINIFVSLMSLSFQKMFYNMNILHLVQAFECYKYAFSKYIFIFYGFQNLNQFTI